MKAETLRPLADKSAFVAAQKRGRAVQLVCSAHRRRRTTCGSAVLLGCIVSGGCWRGDPAVRQAAGLMKTGGAAPRDRAPRWAMVVARRK